MTVFERVKYLCKERGITLQTLAEKTDMSINSLYKWKTSNPSIDKLEAVAEYFKVSTDYLLGRTDNPSLDTKEEDHITTFFRINTANMDPEIKEEIEEELKNYTEFLIKKALEKKQRRNNK